LTKNSIKMSILLTTEFHQNFGNLAIKCIMGANPFSASYFGAMCFVLLVLNSCQQFKTFAQAINRASFLVRARARYQSIFFFVGASFWINQSIQLTPSILLGFGFIYSKSIDQPIPIIGYTCIANSARVCVCISNPPFIA
jgi:hypothetical protein